MNFEIFTENVIALLDMLKRRKFNFHKLYILTPMFSLVVLLFRQNEKVLQDIKGVMKMDKKKIGWCIILLGVVVAVAIILLK